MTVKFGVKKLETSPDIQSGAYHISYFYILNHLGVAHECDRQTDGQTDSF